MRYFVGDLVVGYHRWIHGEWDFFGWAERVSWDRVLGGGSRDVHDLSLWFTPWNDHVRTWKMDGWNTSFLLRLPIFRATVDGRNPAPPGINKSKTCVRYHPFWLELGERQSWGGPVLLSHVCVCAYQSCFLMCWPLPAKRVTEVRGLICVCYFVEDGYDRQRLYVWIRDTAETCAIARCEIYFHYGGRLTPNLDELGITFVSCISHDRCYIQMFMSTEIC